MYKDFDQKYKCEITDDEDWQVTPEDKKVNVSFVQSKVRRIRKDGYRQSAVYSSSLRKLDQVVSPPEALQVRHFDSAVTALDTLKKVNKF